MAFSHIASKTTAATAALAAAGLLAAAPAFADPQVLQFGQMAEISSNGGTIDYTVSNLQPSGHNDGVWYSDVTAKGVSGNAVPNIADFNARAVNSSTFAVMKGNQTDGLPEGPLPLGTPSRDAFTSTCATARTPTASSTGTPEARTRWSGRASRSGERLIRATARTAQPCR